jgi:xylulokinase
LLALAAAPYGLERPKPGHVEQDPEQYWTAAVRCLRDLLASPAADTRRLAALSACGQAPTLVLLDGEQRPVRRAILWQDTRAAAEAVRLARDPGTDVLAEWLGVRWPVDASLPLARFLWLREHEPETLGRVAAILQPKDFVHLRLTGQVASDQWSAKGLAHVTTRAPIAALRNLCDVDLTAVPAALISHQVMGRVSAAGSAATALPEGLPVAAGWTDALSAMLGTGALGTPGLACDVSGTSEVVGVVQAHRPLATGPLMAAPILDSERWMLYGPTQASGGSLGWALKTVRSPKPAQGSQPAGVPAQGSRPATGPRSGTTGLSGRDGPRAETERSEGSDLPAGDADVAAALAAAAATPPGAGGLLFLPYLEGERAPVWDPLARGAFVGLTSTHEPAHLFRAVLEGVACSVRHLLSAAEAASGQGVAEIRVAGGGARLALWNQVKADVTGCPVRPCVVSENGVLGAAMLAALGAGLFSDVEQASAAMVALQEPCVPNRAHGAVYDRTFERYTALYPRLRDLFA